MNNEVTYIVSLDLECHRQPELLVCSAAVPVGSTCEHWTAAGFAAVCEDSAMVPSSDQTVGGNQPFPNYYIAGMMVLCFTLTDVFLLKGCSHDMITTAIFYHSKWVARDSM